MIPCESPNREHRKIEDDEIYESFPSKQTQSDEQWGSYARLNNEEFIWSSKAENFNYVEFSCVPFKCDETRSYDKGVAAWFKTNDVI